ncbi:hypothetical protein CAPTEDRAFT_146545, partial [Capitella teleta]
QRIKKLRLPSLTYRRLRTDLIETYKIINGLTNVKHTDVLPPIQTTLTQGHRHKLTKQRTNTTTYSTAF